MAREIKKSTIKTTVVRFNPEVNLGQLNKHSNFSSFDISPFFSNNISQDEFKKISDYEFSLLIEESVNSVVYANLVELSKTKYIKSGCTCEHSDQDPAGCGAVTIGKVMPRSPAGKAKALKV